MNVSVPCHEKVKYEMNSFISFLQQKCHVKLKRKINDMTTLYQCKVCLWSSDVGVWLYGPLETNVQEALWPVSKQCSRIICADGGEPLVGTFTEIRSDYVVYLHYVILLTKNLYLRVYLLGIKYRHYKARTYRHTVGTVFLVHIGSNILKVKL